MSDVHVTLRPGDRLIVDYATEAKASPFAESFATLDELPVTPRVARRMIQRGELLATKRGRAYLVKREDAERAFAPSLRTAANDDPDERVIEQLRAKGVRIAGGSR